jgi:hypothetical protein
MNTTYTVKHILKGLFVTIGCLLLSGIPALTPAAGRCTLRNVLYTGCSINLNDAETDAGISRPNDWPEHSDYNGQWCHSDMKDVAYFFNFKFYKKAVEKGGLK